MQKSSQYPLPAPEDTRELRELAGRYQAIAEVDTRASATDV